MRGLELEAAAVAAAAARVPHQERDDMYRTLALLMDRLGFPYALDAFQEAERVDHVEECEACHKCQWCALPEPKPELWAPITPFSLRGNVITHQHNGAGGWELLIGIGVAVPLHFHKVASVLVPEPGGFSGYRPVRVGECISFGFRPFFLDVVNGAVVFRCGSLQFLRVLP